MVMRLLHRLPVAVAVVLTTTTDCVSAQFNASPKTTTGTAESTGGAKQTSPTTTSLYRQRHGRLCDTTDPGALSVVLTSSSDATLFADEGDVAASVNAFAVGRTPTGVRRALLSFDVASADLPADAHVECAELGLYVDASTATDEAGDADRSSTPLISLYAVTTQWTTTANTDNVLDVPTLQGGPASQQDCTWTHSSYPDVRWTAPGGDYDDAKELSEDAVDAEGKHWFGSTKNTRDAVQGWIENTQPNYGFLLVGPEEEESDADNKYAYNVYHGMDSDDDAKRPTLVLKYTSPSAGYPVRDMNYWKTVMKTSKSPYAVQRKKDETRLIVTSFAGGFGIALALVGVSVFVKRRMNRRHGNKNIVIDAAVDIELN